MSEGSRPLAPPLVATGALLAGGVATWHLWQRVVSMGTLPPIARLLGRLIEPRVGMSAYDPGFGSGRLLRALERHARASAPDAAGTLLDLFGQERDPLAFSAGGPSTLRRFDRIVANPVWGQSLARDVVTDDRYNRFGNGAPPSGLADWAWVAHLLASLADGGRMAVILGAPALSRPQDREMRAAAVEAGALDAVIWCSPTVEMCRVPAVDNRVCEELASVAILVMNGAGRTTGPTLMVDAAPLVRRHGIRYARTLDTISCLHHGRNNLPNVAAIVEPAELALRDYDLRPTFYLSP